MAIIILGLLHLHLPAEQLPFSSSFQHGFVSAHPFSLDLIEISGNT